MSAYHVNASYESSSSIIPSQLLSIKSQYCNGHDDNCDGVVDEDGSLDSLDWYLDSDGDNFGDVSQILQQCYQPTGYVADSTDCDDVDGNIYPQADEYCNSIDDDCDGTIDEGDSVDAVVYFADSDGDGFGNSGSVLSSCSVPSGYVLDSTDCDDGDGTINPNGTEVCDGGIDNDCDGYADDADPQGSIGLQTWYTDNDQDGYGTTSSISSCDPGSGYSLNSTDCDDGNSSVSPGSAEVCGNGLDDDCDGSYSENCSSSFYNCGGPGAFDSGQSHGCGFGGSRYVHKVRVSAGCNDGETGYYTVSFDDGSSVSFSAGCGTEHSFTPRMVSSATIYMNSGGGGDNHISWTCCGSSGWGVFYY